MSAIKYEVEAKAREVEKTPEVDKLLVGKYRYALVGYAEKSYVIIGAPKVSGERWVTLAPIVGGLTYSLPESRFYDTFWRPED